MQISDRIDSVKGIGEKTRALFEKLDVTTVGRLLTYYPREYETFSGPTPIASLKEGNQGVLEASVSRISETRTGGRMHILTCVATDPSGSIVLTWFNQPYMKKQLSMGYRYVFRGKITRKGSQLRMEQPKVYKREEYAMLQNVLQPVYPLTKGLTNHLVSKSVKQALSLAGDLPEYVPAAIRREYGLLKRKNTLEEIHFPKCRETLLEARKSLVFEEFFLFSVYLRELAGSKETKNGAVMLRDVCECDLLIKSLPYELTGDQKKVWEEIKSDLGSGCVMARLVQGDVGSGKTILAMLSLLLTVKNGYQGCLMVPTEVLAKQHFDAAKKLLEPFGVAITLLVGSMSAKEKREAYEKMKTGETDIIVGTHALIQEKAEYAGLGLVITDEQHRFGVKQREKLAGKGKEPHILVMSATPIPRTLAMMLYGDMDISVIKELPAERLPIKNCVVGTDYRETAYKFMEKQLAAGHQIYIICSMVEESESSDLENVTDYTERMKERFGSGVCVEALHGKMKAEEKTSVMERFASGEIQILVSTTVVEVGVNVPNATVIMIENAERFGLAQLHQLRGRVGRGSAQSYCIIMSGNSDEQTMERLNILNKSNDGFFIASEDLRLRGPGDLFGIRQSGDMTFKIGDIYQDADCLKEANEAANRLTAEDRKQILEDLCRNGANDIFLFLDAYSTI
ncbi:MAG: ATP-dependent DNA helicase RecG [Lachnospiraceae bacterium]|nr:ATP-dependent DNA helicase RecG [Lachnospiraceae bacterium]